MVRKPCAAARGAVPQPAKLRNACNLSMLRSLHTHVAATIWDLSSAVRGIRIKGHGTQAVRCSAGGSSAAGDVAQCRNLSLLDPLRTLLLLSYGTCHQQYRGIRIACNDTLYTAARGESCMAEISMHGCMWNSKAEEHTVTEMSLVGVHVRYGLHA
jgi:hypothetical protein